MRHAILTRNYSILTGNQILHDRKRREATETKEGKKVTPTELLAMRLLDTASLEQRMMYQKIGAQTVAELIIRTGDIFKKWGAKNAMQDILQPERGNHPTEGTVEPEES